ncbi:MAG: Co2+/Mg2+ efflux protein ApaG [Rhodospirillales bacterium]|nr:Co2+/Mg2+ efflux protein ApaG [Rhodospirillales bacterium]
MTELQAFEQITDDIRVLVASAYIEEQSDPDENRHVWAYQVRVENLGTQPVQLLTRRWRITDGNGRAHEVIGDGVVGDKPVLKPGDHYEYSSGTPLATSTGFMTGVFQMIDGNGRRFVVQVPAFSLDGPEPPRAVH